MHMRTRFVFRVGDEEVWVRFCPGVALPLNECFAALFEATKGKRKSFRQQQKMHARLLRSSMLYVTFCHLKETK